MYVMSITFKYIYLFYKNKSRKRSCFRSSELEEKDLGHDLKHEDANSFSHPF